MFPCEVIHAALFDSTSGWKDQREFFSFSFGNPNIRELDLKALAEREIIKRTMIYT